MKPVLRLVADSHNALRRSLNLEPFKIRVTTPEPLMLHFRHTDPDGSVGAFDGDRLIGYGAAIVRDNQWFLGFLFVKPGKWSKGIGRRLLKRTLAIADPKEVSLFSLCTFSHNPHAIGLYSSFGMSPQTVILNLRWKRELGRKLRIGRPERTLSMKTIDDYENLSFINKLDKKNRGILRPEEHKFFIDNDKTEIVEFYDKRKPVGYAVLYKTGWIAPISVIAPEYLVEITKTCVRLHLDADQKEIALNCPGTNALMLKYLFGCGFRTELPLLLMSNRPFANLDCYLPASLAIF